ncbi:MAG: hypothetical protein ABH879_10445 [archaeon]
MMLLYLTHSKNMDVAADLAAACGIDHVIETTAIPLDGHTGVVLVGHQTSKKGFAVFPDMDTYRQFLIQVHRQGGRYIAGIEIGGLGLPDYGIGVDYRIRVDRDTADELGEEIRDFFEHPEKYLRKKPSK